MKSFHQWKKTNSNGWKKKINDVKRYITKIYRNNYLHKLVIQFVITVHLVLPEKVV